ncbi:hypothetical protein M758_4G108500 [Ceratodon purpureus]|nr:hypothetical protein M758_4G108500 [Ceratodon purpureus]
MTRFKNCSSSISRSLNLLSWTLQGRLFPHFSSLRSFPIGPNLCLLLSIQIAILAHGKDQGTNVPQAPHLRRRRTRVRLQKGEEMIHWDQIS